VSSPELNGLAATSPAAPLLEAKGLTRHFKIGGLRSHAILHAVDDFNLTIHEHEIVALVGESGSGKSTVARLLAKVYKPTDGDVTFRGRSLQSLRSRSDVLSYRGAVPMVFQDPFSSLNPVHTIGYILERGLRLHRKDLNRSQRQEEAERVMNAVGLVPAKRNLAKHPYEMSGGQRQRVGFAQALSYRPALILADEPVSMLDVSIRVGLLNLMVDLRDREGLSLLYITHDIASARYVADRVVVLYAGQMAESGPTEDVLHRPAHPYTQLLLSAVPDPKAEASVSTSDVGEPPKVVNPGPGCRFRFRCPHAMDICHTTDPTQTVVGDEHQAACHLLTLSPTRTGASGS
jgi:oligopeptide/dipeptide ABC transporter ATP-binding protein